jgi:hypothetical protein
MVLVRRFISGDAQMASWGHGTGAGRVSEQIQRGSGMDDRQGHPADWGGGLDTRIAGAFVASIGPFASRGHGPLRPRNLRSRQGDRQRQPGSPGPAARATPWWKSKWWHVAILVLSVLIVILSLIDIFLTHVR